MGRVRYLIVKPAGRDGLPRFYWQPSTPLRALGWLSRRLTAATLAEAEEIAERLNLELDAQRKSEPPPTAPIVERRSKHVLKGADLRTWQPQAGGCVYVIGTVNGMQKVGLSREPELRRLTLSHASGQELRIWLVVAGRGIDARAVERNAHQRLGHRRREGEWFAVKPEQAIAAVIAAVGDLAARTIPNTEGVGTVQEQNAASVKLT